MREWILEQGVILYVFAGCLVVGIISAFIANHGYKRLIKESELMGNTGNRLLKYIKLKIGSYYKLNMRPQDTRALTKHYMYKYKIGFMNVLSWIKVSRLTIGVTAISAIVYLLWMQTQGKTAAQMMSMAGCGIICGGIVYIMNRLYDFPEKQNMLEWYLMDYLENFLKNKIESAPGIQNGAVGNRQPIQENHLKSEAKKESADTAAASKIPEDNPLPNPSSEIFNNDMDERILWRTNGHPYNEAAASKTYRAVDKRSGTSHSRSLCEENPEDAMDARIVEDILREFLN